MEVRICIQFNQKLWALRLELGGGSSTLMDLEVKPSVRNHTQNLNLYSKSYIAGNCVRIYNTHITIAQLPGTRLCKIFRMNKSNVG